MRTALHPTRVAPGVSGGMFRDLGESALLTTPAALEIVARIDAATDEAFPHRRTHVRQVALVVMRAKGLG